MPETEFTIGQLAARTGCKVQTVRYYEQIGLLSEPPRSNGNQRRYTPVHLSRLAFVRHGRELGFPLDAIRELLHLVDNPAGPCVGADRIARRQLQQVKSRIARLLALKRELERMISRCRGGRIADCRIIEVLADHSHCHADHAPLAM